MCERSHNCLYTHAYSVMCIDEHRRKKSPPLCPYCRGAVCTTLSLGPPLLLPAVQEAAGAEMGRDVYMRVCVSIDCISGAQYRPAATYSELRGSKEWHTTRATGASTVRSHITVVGGSLSCKKDTPLTDGCVVMGGLLAGDCTSRPRAGRHSGTVHHTGFPAHGCEVRMARDPPSFLLKYLRALCSCAAAV